MSMLERVYKSHDKWINTVLKFGCNKEEAEDIVSEMYLIIATYLKKGRDISYGDDVNYYYIYLTLRTTFLLALKKKNKENKVSLDLVTEVESDDFIDYDNINEIVSDELQNMHFYREKVFNIIENGCSVSELSRRTTIDYHSLYRTYRGVKKQIKNKIID